MKCASAVMTLSARLKWLLVGTAAGVAIARTLWPRPIERIWW